MRSHLFTQYNRFISLHIVHCCKTIRTGIHFYSTAISFLQAVLSFVYLGIGTAVVSFLRKYEQTLSTWQLQCVCTLQYLLSADHSCASYWTWLLSQGDREIRFPTCEKKTVNTLLVFQICYLSSWCKVQVVLLKFLSKEYMKTVEYM
jgi:hypothetical protein